MTAAEAATTPFNDRPTFSAAVERHRRELHLHCYRMLASFDEAEDAVQETLLRAWRFRASFDGSQLRAWLYRIATNVCLDPATPVVSPGRDAGVDGGGAMAPAISRSAPR